MKEESKQKSEEDLRKEKRKIIKRRIVGRKR